MRFYEKVMGDPYCPICGEELKWIKTIRGTWIACNTRPILYIPGKGKMWLVDSMYEGMVLHDCLIYKPGLGYDLDLVEKGFEPHIFTCIQRDDFLRNRRKNG